MKIFCTAVNCMDGRVQLPVIRYLQHRFNANYVDTISEPGPNRILAEGTDMDTIKSIDRRLAISVESHQSVGIAVVGHYDCAGNPSSEEQQREQTAAALRYIRSRFESVPVIGLWVDENWDVFEIQSDSPNELTQLGYLEAGNSECRYPNGKLKAVRLIKELR